MKRLALLVLLVGCAGPNMDYYGGPGWRVFDVQRIEGVDARRVLYDMHRSVEECTGHERSFWKVKAYTAGVILSLREDGKFRRVAGLSKDHRIYVVRGLGPAETRGTLRHEFGHYITDMSHPDVDPLLEACGIPITMRLP